MLIWLRPLFPFLSPAGGGDAINGPHADMDIIYRASPVRTPYAATTHSILYPHVPPPPKKFVNRNYVGKKSNCLRCI